jgi:hypothetical protein
MKKYSVIMKTFELTDSQMMRLDTALDKFSRDHPGLIDKIALCELKEGRL